MCSSSDLFRSAAIVARSDRYRDRRKGPGISLFGTRISTEKKPACGKPASGFQITTRGGQVGDFAAAQIRYAILPAAHIYPTATLFKRSIGLSALTNVNRRQKLASSGRSRGVSEGLFDCAKARWSRRWVGSWRGSCVCRMQTPRAGMPRRRCSRVS